MLLLLLGIIPARVHQTHTNPARHYLVGTPLLSTSPLVYHRLSCLINIPSTADQRPFRNHRQLSSFATQESSAPHTAKSDHQVPPSSTIITTSLFPVGLISHSILLINATRVSSLTTPSVALIDHEYKADLTTRSVCIFSREQIHPQPTDHGSYQHEHHL